MTEEGFVLFPDDGYELRHPAHGGEDGLIMNTACNNLFIYHPVTSVLFHR